MTKKISWLQHFILWSASTNWHQLFNPILLKQKHTKEQIIVHSKCKCICSKRYKYVICKLDKYLYAHASTLVNAVREEVICNQNWQRNSYRSFLTFLLGSIGKVEQLSLYLQQTSKLHSGAQLRWGGKQIQRVSSQAGPGPSWMGCVKKIIFTSPQGLPCPPKKFPLNSSSIVKGQSACKLQWSWCQLWTTNETLDYLLRGMLNPDKINN